MKLSAEDVKAIDAAVASVAHRLQPEDRFDLRQELALRLLSRERRPGNVREWLREAAHGWTVDFLRSATKQRELLHELHEFGGGPYRRGAEWRPTWYPPHPDAVEGPWLACEGARLMRVKK
jgi:DNA-directed RNA polymerase specialized sigma24 family protein